MKRLGWLLIALAITCLASPDAWAQRGGGRGFGRGGGLSGVMLLGQESVQAELKLSDEQKQQVVDMLEKQREAFGGFQDLSREERGEKFAELQKENEAAVAKILDETQQVRLKQIGLQQLGGQAFADPKVAAMLGLSDEQKSKIESIQDESRAAMREAFEGGGDRAEMRKKLETMRSATNEKLQGLLTTEQQEKWKVLTGAPFTGELRPFGGGRGRGDGRRGAGPNRQTQANRPQDVFQFASFKSDDDDDSKADRKRDDVGDKAQGKKKADRPSKKPHGKHARHHRHGKHHHAARHRAHHGHHHRYAGRGPNADAWAQIAAALAQRSRWHAPPRPHGRGMFAMMPPHARHRYAMTHGYRHHQHGPPPHAFMHHGRGHFAGPPHPWHGPPHHFASWRHHHHGHPGHGQPHVERRGDGEHRPPMPPPRDRRSQADGPGEFRTGAHPEHDRDVTAERIAELERNLARLAEQIESLRTALLR